MSAATPETIRARIGAILAAVPGAGIVHPYERYAKAEDAFRALYMWQQPGSPNPPELRGWFIRRPAIRQISDTSTQDEVQIDWQIFGFMAVQDAKQSGIVFDVLCDVVRNAFLADVELGGLLDVDLPNASPIGPQLAESSFVMLGGVLCHRARFDWTTRYNVPLGVDPGHPPEGVSVGEFRVFHANWDIPPFGAPPASLPVDATADATDHVIIRPEEEAP